MKRSVCVICGKDFEADNARKYCCSECKVAGAKLMRERWKARNPLYYKMQYRLRNQKEENRTD